MYPRASKPLSASSQGFVSVESVSSLLCWRLRESPGRSGLAPPKRHLSATLRFWQWLQGHSRLH